MIMATSFPGSFLPPDRTLGASGQVTAHDKLLPSQGTLTLLFCSQGMNRLHARAKEREMREIWRNNIG